jgi:hypothetical protein
MSCIDGAHSARVELLHLLLRLIDNSSMAYITCTLASVSRTDRHTPTDLPPSTATQPHLP